MWIRAGNFRSHWKLQLNRQRYGKRRVCVTVNSQRYKASERARFILPMTNVARGLQYARRVCAEYSARAPVVIIFIDRVQRESKTGF